MPVRLNNWLPRLKLWSRSVCSCTIVPLFAGVYRKGAGIGPAITFLFFAPAGNIMALAYTGSILGAEFAIARLILCLVFGIGIGLLVADSDCCGYSGLDRAQGQKTSSLDIAIDLIAGFACQPRENQAAPSCV
jgi:uncharacterized membrane protein YraQ (UPF0718 family)